MYVYIQSEKPCKENSYRALYTVGFYDPNGRWHSESDFSQEHLAAHRVHFLNGGNLQVHEMHEFT